MQLIGRVGANRRNRSVLPRLEDDLPALQHRPLVSIVVPWNDEQKRADHQHLTHNRLSQWVHINNSLAAQHISSSTLFTLVTWQPRDTTPWSSMKYLYLLADCTNIHAYPTVLCLSVCLSSVMYVLWLNGACYRKNCQKKHIRNGPWESNGQVTDDIMWPWKSQSCDSNTLRAQYLENSWREREREDRL